MKKVLLLVGAVVLVAAACNSQTTYTPPKNTAKTTSSSKVDATVDKLNASVDSEDTVNMQSYDDIVNSDQGVISSYNGATNASY